MPINTFPTLLILTTVCLLGSSFPSLLSNGSGVHPAGRMSTVDLYQAINFGDTEKPDFEMFDKGIEGYNRLKEDHKLSGDEILTLIDFSKSANVKRLWVIGLKDKKVLYHSLVAHGRNSGDVYASRFSNLPNSNKSSLGFYATGVMYTGKHGLSLILHGLEKGINDQAEARAIVMHGADYVSDSYIRRIGRLGRSLGCPALPLDVYQEIIKKLAGGTCLFIYYPDEDYLKRSIIVSGDAMNTSIISHGS